MTDIEVLEREKQCVQRKAATNCFDCARCDLLMDDAVILAAYDHAISALRHRGTITKCHDLFDEDGGEIPLNAQTMTMDDAILHLDDTLSDTGRRWSCESCRMEHVQLRSWLTELRDIKQKRNDPLTLDELRKMGGEPVWCKEMQCYGIVKVEAIGRWANMPFLVGAWHEGDGAVNFEYDICGRKLTLYRRKPEEGTV